MFFFFSFNNLSIHLNEFVFNQFVYFVHQSQNFSSPLSRERDLRERERALSAAWWLLFVLFVCVSVFVLNIHHSRIDMKHWDPFCLCDCVREIFFVKLTPLFTSFSRVQKSLCLCLCVCFRCHSSALFSFSSWLFVCVFFER